MTELKPQSRMGKNAGYARSIALKIVGKKSGKIGVVILVAILSFVLAGSFVIPYSPTAASGAPNSPPSSTHIFGTDYIGRDVASMIVWGAYPSMFVSLLASLGAVLIGLTVGVFSGYYRRLEGILTGSADVVMTFPAFPLMILLGMLYTPTNLIITIILIIVLWAPVSRAIRSQVLSVKERPFVEAAIVSGRRDLEIIARVIVPEVATIAIAYFVLMLSVSLVFVTGLEFLGVGNIEVVSWGTILYWAQQFAFYNGAWWWILAPGVFITLFATGFALLGFSVEEVMNPRLRAGA
ncbi:MAG: ABC transporter permease [Nitrososphaerales archaeon]